MLRNLASILLSLAFGMLLAACGSASQAGDQAPPLTPDATIPIKGPQASGRLDQFLNNVYLEWAVAHNTGSEFDAAVAASKNGLELDGDRVMTVIMMQDKQAADDLIPMLPDYGAELSSQYEELLSVWVPISQLVEVAKLRGVAFIKSPAQAHDE